MKKLVKLVLILIIAYPLAGIVISSCTDESDCSMAGRAMLRATINTIVDEKMVNDTLDSLTITAFMTDSIILNNEKRVSEVYLPLQYTNDTTILVFHYSKTGRDTITIRHTNNPKFVSMDCGYEMKQAILGLKYTEHRLDSIHITNQSTNTDGTKNLELFYIRPN